MLDCEELVYGSDQDDENIGMSSEPVQGLATRVYKEFEKMIAKYDQDVVRDLMPLVVTMLETLDKTIKDQSESVVEIELLEEDKKQLKSQFERERQQKRHAEQQLIEAEDASEAISRELKQGNEKHEMAHRQLEMKCKSQSDQLDRLLDRESELKKEYNELHQRHSEMIRSYVEHIEKTKALQQHLTPDSPFSPIGKKTEPESLNTGTLSPLSLISPLKSIASTPGQESVCSADNAYKQRLDWNEPIDPFHPNIKQEITDFTKKSGEILSEETTGENPTIGKDNSAEINSDRASLESGSSGADSGTILTQEFQQNILKMGCPTDITTPLHGIEGDDTSLTRHQINLEKTAVENEGFNHVVSNHESLYIEMCGNDLGDVDEGADILGMGKELESLILENTKLMATKNALDIVKDDLIHQVDQLTNQLTMLQEDLEHAHQAKESLSKRVTRLENELKQAEKINKEHAEASPSSQTAETPVEDGVMPTAQRKRFTRIEMARVLMERNHYKERLMELQEAVRWTEMLRASRDHPSEITSPSKSKSKSSISQFFSRLFSSSSSVNISPSKRRDEAKISHSLSDSFTTSQLNTGK